MIEVTDAAATEIKQLLEKENKKDYALRVFAAGVGCGGTQYGLKLEESPNSNDTVRDIKGIKMLYEQDMEEELDGYEIDFIDNEYGRGFIIHNPNMTCGSGCSSCG